MGTLEVGEIGQGFSGSGSLLGRDREFTVLRARFGEASDGRGRLVLVTGEAGIGKTRLADEFTTYAKAAGAVVAWGTSIDGAVLPHYWPWMQVLRHCVDELGPGSVSGPLGADLAPLLSGGGRPPSPDPAVTHGDEPQARRFRLFQAVTSALHRMSRQRPLVVVLDDLQWAEKPSVLLLEFVASQLHGSRLLLLVCVRSPDAPGQDGQDAPVEALARLARLGDTVTLNGLDATDVARLLRRTAGTSVTDGLAAQVHHRSAGNPFFVQELARLLLAQGRLTEHTSANLSPALPRTVREVVDRRLARLSDSCARVLAAASVAGTEFDVEVLAPVVGTSALELADLLRDAVRASVVTPSSVQNRYRFTHPLIREALYTDVTPSVRAALHGALAEAIEQSTPDPDATLSVLAQHFHLAAGAGDPVKALDYSRRAGGHALGRLAYEEAADHFGHALEVLDLLRGDEAQRVALLLALGDARMRAGDVPGSTAAYQEAVALARRRQEPDELARAALGLTGGAGGFEVRLVDQSRLDLLREALAALGTQDSALRSWTLGRLSVAATFVEPVTRRREWSRDAAVVARRVGDPAALAHALAGYCDAISGPQHVEERLAVAGEIVTVAQAHRDPDMELLGRRLRLVALLESADIPGVDAEIAAYERVAEAVRQPLFAWYVPLWKGMRAVMEGRLDESGTLLARARAVGEQANSRNAHILTVVLDLWRLLEYGEAEQACTRLERFTDERESGFNHPLFRVGFHARAGRRTEAGALLSSLAANDFAQVVMDDTAAVAGLCFAADAAADLGDRDAAAVLYDMLRPHAGRFAVSGIAAACLGSVAGFLGRLAHVLDRWQAAEEHFRDAVDAHRRNGATLLLAHTLRHYAAMRLAREGSAADAGSSLLQEAVAIYQALDLDHWARESGHPLARESGHPPAREARQLPARESRQPPAHAPETTGPSGECAFWREGEVWLLRFAGEEARVKDSKGMRDLARLLTAPTNEIHVLDLVAQAGPGRPPAGTDDLHPQGHLGPLIDDRARAEYQRRLAELDAEAEEMERIGDRERAGQARAERETLVAHLAAAYGLGGRPRHAGDPSERARSAVTWRIRSALDRIRRAHPALGRHLTHCVKTGTYCCYAPEQPITWDVRL